MINYGWDDKGFEWGKCRNLNNSALKQAQLKQIGDLMSFVDGRVKLSKGGPGFLYWDDTSALQYAIQHEDYELLENLTEFTLSDPNHIASVLESKTFGAFKLRLLEVWLRYETDDLDHNSILHNLLHYAQQVKDNSLIKRVSEELNSESEHDDVITQTKNMQISPLTKTNANLFKSAVTNINTKPTTINLNITPTKAMKPPFTQFN